MDSFPKFSKKEIERRRFPRVMAPVLYRIPRTQADKKRVSNLSLGGVRIYSDERLDTAQVLDLEFFLPNGSVVGAKARVVWVKELPPGSKGVYDVGMELIKLSGKAWKELALVLRQK
ncbi:MAG: PilZ domain-containing protein [Clostridiales bacterium]|nr:PilZ domain-containing protein [Clostridiales bacterium]